MPNGIPRDDPLREWAQNVTEDLKDLRDAISDGGKELVKAKQELLEAIYTLDLKWTREIASVRLERQRAEQKCVEERISPLALKLKGMSAMWGLLGALLPCGITLLIYFLSR